MAKNEDAISSRGHERQRWLEMFLVHNMRSRAGQKKQVQTQKKIEEADVTHREVWEWSREQMEKELGANKASKWIASGLHPKACCPLTQSWDEDLVVYSVLNLRSNYSISFFAISFCVFEFVYRCSPSIANPIQIET